MTILFILMKKIEVIYRKDTFYIEMNLSNNSRCLFLICSNSARKLFFKLVSNCS